MTISRLISKIFQVYWRRSRGLDLAVACCFTDEQRRVLLAKCAHGLWTWPRVQVLEGESSRQALARLELSLNIRGRGQPRLFGIDEPSAAGNPYIAFYVGDVSADAIRLSPTEPPRWQTFSIDELPADVNDDVRHRLEELAL